jgi:hypothetical protein
MRGFGALAIFAGMTADRPDSAKKESAFKAAFAVAVILHHTARTGSGRWRHIALMGLSLLHSKTSAMSHTKAEGDAAAASP